MTVVELFHAWLDYLGSGILLNDAVDSKVIAMVIY